MNRHEPSTHTIVRYTCISHVMQTIKCDKQLELHIRNCINLANRIDDWELEQLRRTHNIIASTK